MTLAVAAFLTAFAIFLVVGRSARRHMLDSDVGYYPAHIRSKWADKVELYLHARTDYFVQPLTLNRREDISPMGAWRTFRHVMREWPLLRAMAVGIGVLYASQLRYMERAIVVLGRINPQLQIRVRSWLRGQEVEVKATCQETHNDPSASFPF